MKIGQVVPRERHACVPLSSSRIRALAFELSHRALASSSIPAPPLPFDELGSAGAFMQRAEPYVCVETTMLFIATGGVRGEGRRWGCGGLRGVASHQHKHKAAALPASDQVSHVVGVTGIWHRFTDCCRTVSLNLKLIRQQVLC